MSTKIQPLGSCPRCEASIPPSNLLVQYERADGEAMYAACPDCETPVHPA